MGSSSDVQARAQTFLSAIVSEAEAQPAKSFDSLALRGIKIVEATPGRCICSFKAEPERLNRYGTLHGGCIATLVDSVSTVALVTEINESGVSVNLAVTYMKPVPGGADVTVDAQVVRTGRQLATIQVDILVQGSLCARGVHTKFLPGTGLPGLDGKSQLPRSKL
mmetsp:Transcript_1192/g.3372  ORF Transcript_1192/g.3372 Transcript_1192/m.3372 type:complete len:165 (+) Transcript_1192:188-682(+)